MASYAMCVSCCCNEDGNDIYKCRDCKKMFCRQCADTVPIPRLFWTEHEIHCPDCNSEKVKTLGEVMTVLAKEKAYG